MFRSTVYVHVPHGRGLHTLRMVTPTPPRVDDVVMMRIDGVRWGAFVERVDEVAVGGAARYVLAPGTNIWYKRRWYHFMRK